MLKKTLSSALALVLVAGLAACPGPEDDWETEPAAETPPVTEPADPTWDDPAIDDTLLHEDTLYMEEDDWGEGETQPGTGTDY